MIGPLAQLAVIPFMTDREGADLIGDWFGTTQGRGIALILTVSGLIRVGGGRFELTFRRPHVVR